MLFRFFHLCTGKYDGTSHMAGKVRACCGTASNDPMYIFADHQEEGIESRLDIIVWTDAGMLHGLLHGNYAGGNHAGLLWNGSRRFSQKLFASDQMDAMCVAEYDIGSDIYFDSLVQR